MFKKILFIDTCYDSFINQMYAKEPGLKNLLYKDQLKHILNYRFAGSDFYSKNFEILGYHAEDVIPNATILQNAWAKENKISGDIVLSQIKSMNPDIIYVLNINYFPIQTLIMMKSMCKLLIGQLGCGMASHNYKYFDLIITQFKEMQYWLQKNGANSEYLKLGFETTLLSELPIIKNRSIDVSFIGSFVPSMHHGIIDTFEYIAERFNINFWGQRYDTLSNNSNIRKKYKGEVWGKDMYEILLNSKISLNRHAVHKFWNTPMSLNNTGNMRMYEVTGCKALLLTDYKEDLSDYFKIGQEIDCYKDKYELAEKIEFYLKNETKRLEVANFGHQRCLKDYSYLNRMKDTENVIIKYLRKKRI